MMKFLILLSLLIANQAFALSIKVLGTKNSFLTKEHEFKGFGCSGKNTQPAIEIADLPKNTKSLAITVYDPDAPTGAGWWHWLAFNIPVSKTKIMANDPKLKELGVTQTTNSYGTQVFGGACPPKGDKAHRYIFTVYALKVESLDLKPSTTPGIVGFTLNGNAIAKATATTLYSR